MQQDWQLVNLYNALEAGLLNSRARSEWTFNQIRSNGFNVTMRSVLPSDTDGEYWEQIKGIPASLIWNLNKEADELLSLHQYQSALECARDSGKLPWPSIYARETNRMEQFNQTVFGAGKFSSCRFLLSAIAIPNISKSSKSRLTREEMLKTLTCGVGMALVCRPKHVAEVEAIVRAHNHVAMALGRVDLQSGAKLHDPAAAESRVVY